MALLLKGARVIDPQVGIDEVCDVLVRDGRVVEVGRGLALAKGVERDLAGKVLVPGLVDMHVHLRDPGQEYKEDIASGTRAAATGGFTDVCCMPNTAPVIDTGALVDYVHVRAANVGKCRVHVAGACTKGLAGVELSEMGDMIAHGAVAFTDDGRGVQGAGMMRRVMDYAVQFGCPVMSHCQDEDLVGHGQVNEGAASTRLGLAGWPATGEELQVARDIELSRLTGCPIHIQHITTARGLDAVRRGKREGVRVTCEATPHHLFLTDEDISSDYDTSLKVNPPLRTRSDADALIAGLVDGTIDCIVTDHAPHAAFEKDRSFESAPFGMIGLETSLSLILTHLVAPGRLSWNRMVELMCVAPRSILGLEPVRFEPGSRADFTAIDPNVSWEVGAGGFASKSKNTPFSGQRLVGRASDVWVGGYSTLHAGALTDEPIHLD